MQWRVCECSDGLAAVFMVQFDLAACLRRSTNSSATSPASLEAVRKRPSHPYMHVFCFCCRLLHGFRSDFRILKSIFEVGIVCQWPRPGYTIV